jgi:hypothetical protein
MRIKCFSEARGVFEEDQISFEPQIHCLAVAVAVAVAVAAILAVKLTVRMRMILVFHLT